MYHGSCRARQGAAPPPRGVRLAARRPGRQLVCPMTRALCLVLALTLLWGCESTPSQPVTHTLTVALAGSGSGLVLSAPAGVSCGASCAAGFTAGTMVTLTVTPAAGSAFSGWSGGGCSGTGSCVVTMTAAVTVTATFALQSYTVGGTTTGLVGSGCVLQLNGANNLTLTGNGAFTFPQPLLHGTNFLATLLSQPIGPNQTCALASPGGSVAAANVTTIGVSCTVDRPVCTAAVDLGSLSGDAGSTTLTRTGTGEQWYRLRLTEDNSQAVYLSATIVLVVPAGVDYDLFLYCAVCGGSAVAFSNAGPGATETVRARWDDGFGEDNSGEILVHVRFASGVSPSPWTLQITNNTTVAISTCNF